MATDARTARPTAAHPAASAPQHRAVLAPGPLDEADDPERCIDDMLALAEWIRARRRVDADGRR